MVRDEVYIKRCLQIAKNGNALTKPNPSVGAVIVVNDRIVGEGFTSPFGGPHAEINAINTVQDASILKEATLYVTLEPCSHFGKTPPCANAIVNHKFKRVVIGCLDVNPKVSGNGVRILEEAGIEVEVGVMEAECRGHHQAFFTQHQRNRPHIILKWAQTKEGFMAPPKQEKREPFWITNRYSKQLVHKWRAEEQAILVGTTTVSKDNPKLNTRTWFGKSPLRVVLDAELKLPVDSFVFDQSIRTLVLIDASNAEKITTSSENLFFEPIDYESNMAQQICKVLQKHQIQSVIIEGGAQTLQSFIAANLWDEARVFEGENSIDKGLKAPRVTGNIKSEIAILNDTLTIYTND
ncbi:MAG: riboflavin biosynthesis protein RibD [Flavobacteriaceae bacterium]|nr:riboflavin biosynthesis protein RibD [Flavobacteriaceae bacterium]